jgi:hypothetical protein
MHVHEVRGIEIEASYDHVFAFIADPNNLPRWAHAFERVNGRKARLRTPAGVQDIDLRVESSFKAGTIDWIMTFTDGKTATANSRVTRAPAGRVVYSFVLNAPPLPLELLEVALEEQVRTLEAELNRLKELLER